MATNYITQAPDGTYSFQTFGVQYTTAQAAEQAAKIEAELARTGNYPVAYGALTAILQALAAFAVLEGKDRKRVQRWAAWSPETERMSERAMRLSDTVSEVQS